MRIKFNIYYIIEIKYIIIKHAIFKIIEIFHILIKLGNNNIIEIFDILIINIINIKNILELDHLVIK